MRNLGGGTTVPTWPNTYTPPSWTSRPAATSSRSNGNAVRVVGPIGIGRTKHRFCRTLRLARDDVIRHRAR